VKKRLPGALAAYGILIAIACWRLQGRVLAAVLVVLAGLIARTLIALKTTAHIPD